MPMTPLEQLEAQARYCDANDAPLTAAACRALAGALDRTTATGRRTLDWPGDPLPDALALRLVAGLHDAFRAGIAPELAAIFERGEEKVPAVAATLARHDARLIGWLDSPPQTNEPGRSAQLMTGLLEVAARHGPRLEVLEIGCSAGLNLLIDRFRINLSGVSVGPEQSTVHLTPEWRGSPPPDVPLQIVSTRGVDIAPIDAADPAQAARLLAYVWVDHAIRFGRVAAAIAMQQERAVALDAGDAADWVEARLAEPPYAGVTRVLMHSIVWQYLGAERQARITAAMEAAGAAATSESPLAWVRVEADRTLNRHDITIQSWPGHDAEQTLGHAHAHGFWVERL